MFALLFFNLCEMAAFQQINYSTSNANVNANANNMNYNTSIVVESFYSLLLVIRHTHTQRRNSERNILIKRWKILMKFTLLQAFATLTTKNAISIKAINGHKRT